MRTENQELAKIRERLRNTCDIAGPTSAPDVTYVSGYEVPFAFGPIAAAAYASPFATFATKDTPTSLGVSVFSAAQAQAQSRLDQLLTYAVFDSFEPTDPRGTYLDALRLALIQVSLGRTGTLGIEGRTLPRAVSDFIGAEFPTVKLIEIGEDLDWARLTKTPREIELLRRAANLGDVGQRTLGELVRTPPRSEFELWAEVGGRMSEAAGHDVIVIGDIATGPRTTLNNNPGGPRARIAQTGDGVYMDISVRLDGYWSDGTNSYIVGHVEPTAHQKELVKVTHDAFDSALAQLRPGRRASDVWEAANRVYQHAGIDMPHYMGHQLGTTVNELPRLVPYDHSVIEPNMVFTLEPGAYDGPGGRFGVRSEKIVWVTVSGPEILSQFEWGIPT